MNYQVTLNLPEIVFKQAQKSAQEKKQTLETILVDALMAYLLKKDSAFDEDLETEIGKRALVSSGVESTGWWDSEGDKEWDSWQP